MKPYTFIPLSPRSYADNPRHPGDRTKGLRAGSVVQLSDAEADRLNRSYKGRAGQPAFVLTDGSAPAAPPDERAEMLHEIATLRRMLADALDAKDDADRRAATAEQRAANSEAEWVKAQGENEQFKRQVVAGPAAKPKAVRSAAA